MKLKRESLILVLVVLAVLLMGVVQVIRQVCAARAEGVFVPLPVQKAVTAPVIPRK